MAVSLRAMGKNMPEHSPEQLAPDFFNAFADCDG